METIIDLFGEGKELAPGQMMLRALAIFIIALILIRLSGRSSFGMNMPFDNVIAMLLGSVLSRAVTGASPFLATVAAAAVITFFYRLLAWISLYSHGFGKMIKGESLPLYRNGKLIWKNMRKCLISEKDLMEGVRSTAHVNSLEEIDEVYGERNGRISIIKKKQ